MKKHNRELPKQKKSQSTIMFILALFLGIFLYFGKDQQSITISEKRFEEMMLNKHVQKVSFITNQHLVEVQLKPEFLEKEPYKSEIKRQKSHLMTPLILGNIVYIFRVPSASVFNKNFRKIEEKMDPSDRVGYISEEGSDVAGLLNWLFFILIIGGFWFLMRKVGNGVPGAGSQLFNINKSKAMLFDKEMSTRVTFDDVAGLEEAKEEVQEIVEFLKTPERFTKLGGKIPKGALLIGPPGTGKTLLAKAVAGEAKVPFFSLSGSDFVEMFVGVGAARVRDLFKQAKEKAPCIVFVDEIDAIGRARGKAHAPGINDERENTLNSLLVEMDGFSTNSGVILLAATNRPEVLDTALLRPGRFDRQISIDIPDIKDREAILRGHCKPLKLEKNIKVNQLAKQTPGFSGADLANICNEAALIAARRNRKHIMMEDFQAAIDRTIGGLEKKNKVISPEEKKIVAYHEAGHAVAGWFLEHAYPLVKVSIVPRGVAALGYAQYLPREQFLYQTDQLIDDICMKLGGRAAEEIIFGKISTGALSDIERITKVAYSIVSIYGMSKKIGHVSFYDPERSEYSFGKPYSENTAMTIDEEVKTLIDNAYSRTKKLLLVHQKELEVIAQILLEKETIFEADLKALIGERPFVQREAEATEESMEIKN